MAAEDFIITRKRKLYKFARFGVFGNCYEAEEYLQQSSKITGKYKNIIIELGAGTADLSLELARQDSANLYIAIDVKADRLYTGAAKAISTNINNIIFVRAHAEQLTDLFPAGSVQKIWLTFPDPFPKDRHAKHRMTGAKFLGIYKRIVKKGELLHFKTDNHVLFDWSLEQLVASGARLHKLTYDLHGSNLPADYKIMTRYERKFAGEGLPVYLVDASWT